MAIAFGLSYREVAQLAVSGALAIFEASIEVMNALVERCERDTNQMLSALDGDSQHNDYNDFLRLEMRAGHALHIAPEGKPTRPKL